ncbi:ABC transporter substrate-binding protein [Sciscionella marina]|uniref:ABC transporter substrate-binding protein n=1 Tax=Sciscionella marina TaxID=508770 RepID=UPI00035CDBF7|nr:ABC transporter substrate-binding protein [Sciscionella marina]
MSERAATFVRRRLLPAVVFVVAILVPTVTACGPASPEQQNRRHGGELTIDHQFGETTVAGHPHRIVSMNPAWTDALAGLHQPITAEFFSQGFSGSHGSFPWTPRHRAEIVTMSGKTIPYEKVAAVKPDLILAGYQNKNSYQRLSEIAPTIPVMTKNAILDGWQDITTTAGRILGKEDEARSLVDNANAKIADFREHFSGTSGKTFSFGQFTGTQFGLVTAETDPAARVLTSLGLKLNPIAKEKSRGATRVLVSPENMDVLDSDLLLMWPLGDKARALEKMPGWNKLTAVHKRTAVMLDDQTAMAFSSPSVTSIPWALDHLLRAAFERLAA